MVGPVVGGKRDQDTRAETAGDPGDCVTGLAEDASTLMQYLSAYGEEPVVVSQLSTERFVTGNATLQPGVSLLTLAVECLEAALSFFEKRSKPIVLKTSEKIRVEVFSKEIGHRTADTSVLLVLL